VSRSEQQGQHPGQERMLAAASRGSGRGGSTAGSATGAKAGSKAGAKSNKGATSGSTKGSTKKNDGPERPGASGHRFGPDLACSECGILWDVHQREPKPCKIEKVADAFARRPSGDFTNTAKTAKTATAKAETGESASTSSTSATKTTEAVVESTNKN